MKEVPKTALRFVCLFTFGLRNNNELPSVALEIHKTESKSGFLQEKS